MIQWSNEDAEMAKTYQALLRAAIRAREVAQRFGTPLVVWRDGKVALVPPEDLRLPTAPATNTK